jgi:DNA-binding beta-propeller fold protein YncE
VFTPADLAAAPVSIPILGEDPRSLAVSADGRSVYAAIFESGNGTTILAGGLQDNMLATLPNVVGDPRGPYGGQNPPPNAGALFNPPLDPTRVPPKVGLVVRKDDGGHWLDDNQRDWTPLVSGNLASASGRPVGWDMPDRDIAVIDVASLQVRYITRLMNIVAALAVNPASGDISAIGMESHNEVRFEPNVNGRFVQAMFARVGADADPSRRVLDLNPHLDYRQATVAPNERARSIGDPRAIVWSHDGQRGWVAGFGSGNVAGIDASGNRRGEPIAVGAGPIGLALDETRARLYAWNHFDASLSVLDIDRNAEIARVAVFNPLPAAIRAGRPFLYDTHRTSGLGQAACASCHVDARIDRLAWDLGDPSQPPAPFDQNCVTTIAVLPCQPFHAMKGPMTTQTMQDIIGHEPFHWRGDRAGLEAFNPAYRGLLGDDATLADAEMQAFEDFLATVTFPPNPFRTLDNALPESLPLDGHYTSGRFSMAGQPLVSGNAVRGLDLFTRGLLDPPFQCASCHTLPTGMATNGPLFLGLVAASSGGMVLPAGPHGENHLGIVSVDGSTNVSIKVPQLRNQYEKVGFETTRSENVAGFGFLHDGSVDSLSRFLSARGFTLRSDRDTADLVALMLAFSGSGFGFANPLLGGEAPLSRDTHAAVGQQLTFSGGTPPARLGQLLALAKSGAIDLVVKSARAGFAYDAGQDRFRDDAGLAAQTVESLTALASPSTPQTWTAVPKGLGLRLGIDRDGDGLGDGAERRQGSNPADAGSKTLRPASGPWYNPQRSGHGIDLEMVGNVLAVTWYTYLEDGSPTWYLATAPLADPWVGELQRFTWNPQSGTATGAPVGELRLDFADARRADFSWRIGSRSGSEPMQTLFDGAALPVPDYTGVWYDSREPGWGLGLFSEGEVRGAVVYFYGADHQPRWVLGTGDNASDARLAMSSFRGFCPHCPVVPLVESPAGSIELHFDAGGASRLTTDVFHAAPAEVPWRRGPVPITVLSDPALRPERF